MARLDPESLTSFCRRVLVAVGLSEEVAATVAGSLVAADLRGVSTHGVMRLPIYVERMRRGLIATRPSIRVRRTGPATATLDGGNGPGQVVAMRAMREAVALAEAAGVGLVSVHASNHFGAAGWFALHAAGRGMIGLALTHAEADVIPFGGRRSALGTNPLAVAVPRADGPPIVLDMATSAVAMGRVLLARKRGAQGIGHLLGAVDPARFVAPEAFTVAEELQRELAALGEAFAIDWPGPAPAEPGKEEVQTHGQHDRS